MPAPTPVSIAPGRAETVLAAGLFAIALLFHAWAMSVGWQAKNLPGVEYRQAQTALSTYWIKQAGEFTLDYPTPVLGKPWSIPMEFPFYQWTVVGTSRVTGLGLTKSARVVSMVCFYLCLPAVFLLLGRWGVAPGRRWLVLAFVASCPLYVFYARAFLIETMALMFALWFWVAFERAVAARSRGWLVAAMVAGVGAGLVKVTTLLLYLLPVGVWAALRLWRGRRTGAWRGDLGWMTAAASLPLLATVWWVERADAIKALNPLADFLDSTHMRAFNLGTTALRLAPELWAMKWRIITQEITWLPMIGACLLLFFLGGRHRLGAAWACLLVFGSALVIFPVLYAYHDYYYVANTVALLLAAGLAVVGLGEEPRWRWLGMTTAALCVAAQMLWYAGHYFPIQAGASEGGNALTATLQQYTRADEVIVVAGEDWNSMTPYYARRRALMLRGDVDNDGPILDRAFANLVGTPVGACIITGQDWRVNSELVRRLPALGLNPAPTLTWAKSWVFLPQARAEEVVQGMRLGHRAGIEWAPGAEPPAAQLAGQWHQLANLPAYQRAWFCEMRPQPIRFFTRFEPLSQVVAHEQSFSGHPETRLVFRVKRGSRMLATKLWFNPDAYNLPPADATDGVELRLSVLNADGTARILASRIVDPAHNPADRGLVAIALPFTLEHDAEVELFLGPGPSGRDTRDWVWIRGALTIN